MGPNRDAAPIGAESPRKLFFTYAVEDKV